MSSPQAGRGNSVKVLTVGPTTCTRVGHHVHSCIIPYIEGVAYCTASMLVCRHIIPYLKYLLVRRRLLYSRRSTQSKEGTKPGVLSHAFRFSAVVSPPVLALLVRLPASPSLSVNSTLSLRRTATEDRTVPTRVCVALLGYYAGVAPCLFCVYLPRSRARTLLPVINRWSPVSHSLRVPNTRALLEAATRGLNARQPPASTSALINFSTWEACDSPPRLKLTIYI